MTAISFMVKPPHIATLLDISTTAAQNDLDSLRFHYSISIISSMQRRAPVEFVTISYNHSDYIIEHLESIKHLINTYANGEECIFRLFDDASKDDTVSKVQQWIAQNPELFAQSEIMTSEQNLGVAHNYINALKSITSRRFKIIAGDDLYFDNDVFQVVGQPGLTLTHPLWFHGTETIVAPDLKKCILYAHAQEHGMLYPTIERVMRFENGISAPGAFLGSDLIQEDLIAAISRFHYLEDRPMWNHLFFDMRESIEVRFEPLPYILYRSGSGVSTKKKPATQEPTGYELEVQKLEKLYSPAALDNSFAGKLKRAAYNYGADIRCLWLERTDSHIKELLKARAQAKQVADSYLRRLEHNARSFSQEMQ